MTFILTGTLHSISAPAGLLESLVMPGPVIEGHAKLESECSECHGLFDREEQITLCRDCHEEVDQDMVDKTGFHGRSSAVAETECRSCHSEHLGRNIDITGLNRNAFDHDITDFKLKGNHTVIGCNTCHDETEKFRDAPHECIDCHQKDDIHQETLGKECDSCHTEKQWKKADFDHDETDFPLESAHADASCKACHPANRYENTPTECNDCHHIDDVHNGDYGTDCGECHKPSKWESIRFDHDKETDFPLRGKHESASCGACHKGGLKAEELKTDCNACHAQDDIHRKRFGVDCAECHRESGWKKTGFDHDKDTDFKLKGAHKKASCESCHRTVAKKVTQERSCIDCHRTDDVHRGDQGEQCANCHNEKNWSDNIRFDHDLTNFPLIGLHTALPCEACHLDNQFERASANCNDCHAADDIHTEQLGRNCQACHTPNDWALWRFDHDTQTDFLLDGEHRDLDCLACHLSPLKNRGAMPDNCADCHQEEDVHDGNFGSECDRCHSTDGFDQVIIPN